MLLRGTDRLVHEFEAGQEALLLLADPLEAAVQPPADGQLGHLLLDDVLQLLPGQGGGVSGGGGWDGWAGGDANRYTRLENLAWSHSVF